MRQGFGAQRLCVVADRGMISAATIDHLQESGCSYILGARMRRTREAREEVLKHRGRFEEVHPRDADPKAPSPLKVKEVLIGDRRYVVCLKEARAEKDRHNREAIVTAGSGSGIAIRPTRQRRRDLAPNARRSRAGPACCKRHQRSPMLSNATTLAALQPRAQHKSDCSAQRLFALPANAPPCA